MLFAIWELDRRRGRMFLLNGPHAEIASEEMGVSFAVLAVLLATFGENSIVGKNHTICGTLMGH